MRLEGCSGRGKLIWNHRMKCQNLPEFHIDLVYPKSIYILSDDKSKYRKAVNRLYKEKSPEISMMIETSSVRLRFES